MRRRTQRNKNQTDVKKCGAAAETTVPDATADGAEWFRARRPRIQEGTVYKTQQVHVARVWHIYLFY